ncbi:MULTISPECIES: LmeA family phospholipid-binding protein [Catenuloplanes]|uniref:DUF2993 domain-containing protein n=1 Tax=Catenuloplanes niger TaxID=587534 RepID=A0AAE4CYB7_9ACTN|nr:DUF2993 domain-containing protein [Catenuloplanes niger]MDR7327403.1 hypothetical protein [Catenuloplanes niger]
MLRKPSKAVVAVAAVVALAVPVAADRITAVLAGDRLAARLRCTAAITGDVDVTLRGFPFLTQLARGEFDGVSLRADRVTARDVPLGDVRVEARGLRGTSADALTASAVLPYPALTGLAGDALSGPGLAGAEFGGDGGRLTITTTLPVRGMTMPATVYADLTVDGNRLTVTPGEIELAGLGLRVPASRLPDGMAGARTVALPALPDGLVYQRISATTGGLLLVVAGTGFDLGSGRADEDNNSCGGTRR